MIDLKGQSVTKIGDTGQNSVLEPVSYTHLCHQEKESVSVKEIEDALDAYISILTEIYGIDLKEFDE